MSSLELLKKYFGYDSFRTGQEEIINHILQKEDALAIMPTGAGKSICYQIPALMLPGVSLVISPLISLMQDQVKALNNVGISAAYINSSLTEHQIAKALWNARNGQYKIIYVAPERLLSEGFKSFVSGADISMLTVDEAHCISQWGQDFRPSYLKIAEFIKFLPYRPVVSAFTATATEEVKNDIICSLGMNKPYVTVTGFDRANLMYRVEAVKNKAAYLLTYLAARGEDSGIIYCATRKNVEKLYEALKQKGYPVARYHAGMTAEERKEQQEDFIYDKSPVMIATNAFGMGIDKSNVRYVIHYNMPQSMENYYQEAGRAGRDGADAECILLFSPQDVMINKFLLEQKDFSEIDAEDIESVRQRDIRRLRVMEHYCKTADCLRNEILHYFGERTEGTCGNCGNCQREYREEDMTLEAKWVINCVAETRGRYGQNVVIGTLLGANRAKLIEYGTVHYKSYGALKDKEEALLKKLIDQMLQEGYLTQSDDKYNLLRMGPEVPRLHDESNRVLIKIFEKKETEKLSRNGRTGKRTDELTSAGFELFERLRRLRLQIARSENMPPYIIFNDRTLMEMCSRTPQTEEEMLHISGVGEHKFGRYGEQFIREIKMFCAEHPDRVTRISQEAALKAAGMAAQKEPGKGQPADVDARPRVGYMPWSKAEEEQLLDEYSQEMTVAEIAQIHKRSRGGIRARLKKLGVMD